MAPVSIEGLCHCNLPNAYLMNKIGWFKGYRLKLYAKLMGNIVEIDAVD